MLMPASSEFVALCEAQVSLLTHGLGASLSIVYLTDELTDGTDAKLNPVVAYPEAAKDWSEEQMLALFATGASGTKPNLQFLLPESTSSDIQAALPATYVHDTSSKPPAHPPKVTESAITYQQQIVVPLMHEGMVMGLLVTARSDRAWNDQEHNQVQQIAGTLAIACVLDQRAQWLDHDLRQQRRLQAYQHDIFDDLLHQFRNPLTALRTFGKLLVRRLRPSDPNRNVAESIVRESDRLQDLLLQFDAAIDLGDADLLPRQIQAAPSQSVNWEAQIEPPAGATESSPPETSRPEGMPLLPGAGFLTGADLQVQPLLIAEVLEPLLITAGAIAQERQLELVVEMIADLPPVYADLQAVREVLNNLIDNALKYTPPGGQVLVLSGLRQWQAGQMQQAIAIADTGPGIPAADMAHIFERHYRGVQAESEIPGTGLGLAIARDLVQRMAGDIQVFSPASTCDLIDSWPSLGNSTAEPQIQLQNQQGSTAPGTTLVVWLPETATPDLPSRPSLPTASSG